MRWSGRVAAGVLVALLLAACAGSGEREAVSAAPETSAASGSGSQAVPALLDFRAEAVTGGQVVGAELAGGHLAVWFWAPW